MDSLETSAALRFKNRRGVSRADGDADLARVACTLSASLPDVPTAAEFIPGYLAESWYGAGLPRNTSTEIVDKLNREINAGLADARIAARIVELGAAVQSGSPADFARMIAQETEKWAKVVKASGAKAE